MSRRNGRKTHIGSTLYYIRPEPWFQQLLPVSWLSDEPREATETSATMLFLFSLCEHLLRAAKTICLQKGKTEGTHLNYLWGIHPLTRSVVTNQSPTNQLSQVFIMSNAVWTWMLRQGHSLGLTICFNLFGEGLSKCSLFLDSLIPFTCGAVTQRRPTTLSWWPQPGTECKY